MKLICSAVLTAALVPAPAPATPTEPSVAAREEAGALLPGRADSRPPAGLATSAIDDPATVPGHDVLTPIPEPTTLLLVGSAMVILARRRWRRSPRRGQITI